MEHTTEKKGREKGTVPSLNPVGYTAPNRLHLHRESLQAHFVVLRLLFTDPQNLSGFCHLDKILTVDTDISIW